MKPKFVAVVSALVLAIFASIATGGAAGAAGATYGLLRVTTSPAVPSQISVDGVPRNTWGLDWVKFDPGSHTVCFGDVAGFTTPSCQTITVTAGATTTVVGNFTQRGYLRVATSPATPSRISVDGIGRDNWGLFTDFPTGSHQVCFGAVAGMSVPSCQTVTVSAGATTNVTGTFTPNGGATGLPGVGMLRVTTSPAVPSQVKVDGQIADTWGLNWLEIAPGSHQVCFGDVGGFTTPACQTVSVTSGSTTNVVGTFTQRGYLQVSTSPAVASTISVDGVVRGDWGVFTDLPVGSHQVCFGEVPGFVTPACQTVSLTAGSTKSVTGAFVVAQVGIWTELKTPDGSDTWFPQSTNRAGLVVGQGYYCTGSCATSGQLAMPSGYSPTELTYQTVRDNGAIAGYRMSGDVRLNAVVWPSPSAAPTVLKLPAGWTEPGVWVVTDSGSVIGTGKNSLGDFYVLLWSTPGVTPTTIPVPGGWSYAKAEAYGDNGAAVGWGTSGGLLHGLYVPPPTYGAQILPDPSGMAKGGAAMLINDAGLIVGIGIDAADVQYPVAWTNPSLPPVLLNMPTGYTFGALTSVEDSGMIIGTARDSGGNPRVLVWTSPAAPAAVLSVPAGTTVDSLVGVRDDGTIVCRVTDSGGVASTLVWTSPGAAPFTLTGPPGYSGVLAMGISTGGVIYATSTNPGGTTSILAWTSPGATPLVIQAPPGYSDVTMSIPTVGGPVLAAGYDAEDNPKGLVFVL